MRKQHVFAAALLSGLAGIIILRVYDPATTGIFPPCPFHYLTGLYCPGCGSLRAIHQLLLGNFREAWALNPLTVLFLPFVTYGLASEALVRLRGRGLPHVFLPAIWIQALCVLVILFGIVRNLPFHPFSLLAPGPVI
jgi:hypothetical protein